MNRFINTLKRVFAYKHFFVAGVLTLIGIANFLSLAGKRSWPAIQAAVLESSCAPLPSDPLKASFNFWYRYKVGARTYGSAKVFASIFRADAKYLDDAKDAVRRFPKGANVVAHVNPADPREAYLDLSPAAIDYALPGAGAAGLLCFVLYGYAKNGRKKPNHSTEPLSPSLGGSS